MVAGCPYWVPLEYAEPNDPPYTLVPYPDNESGEPANLTELSLGGQLPTIRITVRDPDADPVYFMWTVSGAEVGTADYFTTGAEAEGTWGHYVTLDLDPELDGKVLAVDFFDGDNEVQREVWDLEVF